MFRIFSHLRYRRELQTNLDDKLFRTLAVTSFVTDKKIRPFLPVRQSIFFGTPTMQNRTRLL